MESLLGLYLAYPTAIAMGLLHGSDPGHGWPLAVFQGRSRGGFKRIAILVTVIAAGHFTSTLAVVGLIWMVGSAVGEATLYLQLAAGAVLILLGLRSLRSHHHHSDNDVWARMGDASIWRMFKYSLLLGFAHEEEVALSAIVLMGANPILLSISYGGAVYVSMLAWATALYSLAKRVEAIERLIHKYGDIATAILFIVVGIVVIAEALFT